MVISIDESSGFCWGVVRTIDIVEETIASNQNSNIYILGQVIHNPRETDRLEAKGLKTIQVEDLPDLAGTDSKVIIRAHGEPPSTYNIAKRFGIELIDATCPLVKTLQKRIRKSHSEGYQIVIFGKKEHSEVIGLRGCCNDDCIVVRSVEEAVEKVESNRKTMLFSQTTMDKPTFYKIKEALENKLKDNFVDNPHIPDFQAKDTICKYVYGREEKLIQFAKSNDVVLFVAGRNSSNGKSLYNVCLSANPKTYFIEDISELKFSWLENINNLGISGATSTPQWYLEFVKNEIEKKLNN